MGVGDRRHRLPRGSGLTPLSHRDDKINHIPRAGGPDRWVDCGLGGNRRELLEEVVHRVMDAEMERAGVLRSDGTKQPLDLPYSYVIHAPDDSNGVESPRAQVIVLAMDRDGERAFNVYRQDAQQTREVAERETGRLFELSRVREWQPELERQPSQEMEPISLDREIRFFDLDR
jgi:hypothetical protein